MSEDKDTTQIMIERKFEWAVLRALSKIENIIRDTGHGRIEIIIADGDIQDVRAMDMLRNPKRHKRNVALEKDK